MYPAAHPSVLVHRLGGGGVAMGDPEGGSWGCQSTTLQEAEDLKKWFIIMDAMVSSHLVHNRLRITIRILSPLI